MRATMTTTLRFRCGCGKRLRIAATHPRQPDLDRANGWSVNVEGSRDRCPECNADAVGGSS